MLRYYTTGPSNISKQHNQLASQHHVLSWPTFDATHWGVKGGEKASPSTVRRCLNFPETPSDQCLMISQPLAIQTHTHALTHARTHTHTHTLSTRDSTLAAHLQIRCAFPDESESRSQEKTGRTFCVSAAVQKRKKKLTPDTQSRNLWYRTVRDGVPFDFTKPLLFWSKVARLRFKVMRSGSRVTRKIQLCGKKECAFRNVFSRGWNWPKGRKRMGGRSWLDTHTRQPGREQKKLLGYPLPWCSDWQQTQWQLRNNDVKRRHLSFEKERQQQWQ